MMKICGMALLAVTMMASLAQAASMTTPWGDKVTAENAWREYPRPQMVRSGWTCLNGQWDYAVTSVTNTPGRPSAWDGKILVPFALESKLSGVEKLLEPDQFLWYTRTIDCAKRPGERILLHFGAVDFRTMVFIGHDEVTGVPHEGGQNPFTLDITDFVKDGANELTLCVWDPTEDFVNSRGKQSFKPTGCYYTRVSGIWQTVWMENVPETYIGGYTVETDIDAGTATFRFDVRSPKSNRPEVEVSVAGAKATSVNGSVTIKMPEGFRLWSPEEPNLYDFVARCGNDSVNGYFGMRKFAKGKDKNGVLRFFLNNRPYYVMATLDQGWWPDGLLTPPSEEAMAFDIQTLKDCGFNAMRKHIKVEPLRYYHLCDKMGLLVVQDLPSGAHNWKSPIEAGTTARYHLQRREQKEMMDTLQAVPSIVMWCPYNEGWTQPGEFLTHSMLDFVRRHDPTRLVNGPSGCWDWEGGEILPNGWSKRVPTVHKPAGVCEAADTMDAHYYRGPAMFPVNDRRISFLGEFGGLGHPVEGHLWKASPDGRGNWGYGGIKDTATREGLEKTYLGLMDKLAPLVEKGLAGSVYTQTTDVEIEINGLMTYDRRVLKFNPAVLKAAHEKIIGIVK
ncbi:MAG: glycoside hydrolase family 2 TIM barrel-domain containing protein [Verrucomicrobiota bacterium]|nr:glycoside hydrolase family 2 TIM barrel-domain containing protein [Verrucomicrobiota bacterium]